MRILTPVDQSARDKVALRYTVRMAKAMDGSITVATVIPFLKALRQSSVRQAGAYLKRVVDEVRAEGVGAESVIERGDVAPALISLAGRLQVDLIVMATRGRTGLGKFVLGSIAETVMGGTPKPVLVLSEADDAVPAGGETHRRSAYLAKVLWNREARGLYSHEQVQEELIRLIESGLDEKVLLATYRSCREQGRVTDWLDVAFQEQTLRTYLPDEAAADTEEPAERSMMKAA